MTKENIKDTIECRQNILNYIKYLKEENERISDDLLMHVVTTIFTEASLIAYRESMQKVETKIHKGLASGKYDMKEAENIFDTTKVLLFKHCIKLEIQHNYTKEDSLKANPQFKEHIIKFA